MTAFTRELKSYRVVATEYGDTLQLIAGRELGDPNRWYELAWINNLVHPYITDDPQRAGPRVVQSGAFIKVPAPKGVRQSTPDVGQVFERDCEMKDRRLQISDGGDLSVLSGSSNLKQQLTHRIVTPRGQATRHPKYGSLFYRLIGRVATPAANLLAAQYAKTTVLSDYRIKSVTYSIANTTGEAAEVEVRAVTISGGPIDVKT